MPRNEGKRVIAVAILAAGPSSRFGSNKLTVKVGDMTLLERAIKTVPRDLVDRISVVIPKESSLDPMIGRSIIKILNTQPERGIGSSISVSTKYFLNEVDAILFMLADQPFITSSDIARLIREFYNSPNCIIACSVDGQPRNPMIFPKIYFDRLSELDGDRGARFIAMANEENLVRVEVNPQHLFDIDTPEDLARVRDSLKKGHVKTLRD